MNLQGKITLTHDGRAYALTINYAALCTFEEVTGKNGFAMLNLLAAGGLQAGLVSARDLRALIYGGLKVHDDTVTLELAGEILDANPDAFVQAIKASMPDEGDVPRGRRRAGKAPAPEEAPGEITLAQLYRNYIAAGFSPDGFWALTPRLYAMQMHAALSRLKIEMTMRNRTAWNTAALVGAAMVGKLPRYDEFFRTDAPESRGPQTPEQQEAALRVLAAAWGAIEQEQ